MSSKFQVRRSAQLCCASLAPFAKSVFENGRSRRKEALEAAESPGEFEPPYLGSYHSQTRSKKLAQQSCALLRATSPAGCWRSQDAAPARNSLSRGSRSAE